MKMRARHAREIRHGILTARAVIARRRVAPRGMTPMFGYGSASPALWELAYYHEFTNAVRDGRVKPPRGPSPLS